MGNKITLATIKRFIKANRASLHISVRSRFDGMIDCERFTDDPEFSPALDPDEGRNHSNCLGIAGAWFVFGSRDYFQPYDDGQFAGYRVSNCCGSFVLAIQKQQVAA